MDSAAVERIMREFLVHAYDSLWAEYSTVTGLCIALYFILPLSVVRFMQLRGLTGSYLFIPTSNKALHFVIALSLVAMGIAPLLVSTTSAWPQGHLASAMLLLVSIAAAIQLLRWRRSGIMLALVTIVFHAVVKNVTWAWLYLVDRQTHLTLQWRYALYSFHDYFAYSGMLLSVASVAYGTFVAAYYYRRRRLFSPVGGPRCQRCHNVTLRKDAFCGYCGEPQPVLRTYPNLPVRLDETRFCTKCGARRIQGVCPQCDGIGPAARETVKEVFAPNIRMGILALAIVLLAVHPIRREPSPDAGTATLNNTVVQRWKDYINDSSLAEDDVWVQGFEESIIALRDADAAWVHIDMRETRFASLISFITYCDAAYQQMLVLERLDEAVNNGGVQQAHSLHQEFDETVDMMQQSVTMKGDNNSTPIATWHALVDGMRYWTIGARDVLTANPQLTRMAFSLTVATLVAYLIRSFGDKGQPAPLAKRASLLWVWVRDGFAALGRGDAQAFLPPNILKERALALLIAFAVICAFAAPSIRSNADEAQFKNMAYDALVTYAQDLQRELILVQSSGSLEGHEYVIDLIERQLELDERVANYRLPDTLSDYDALATELTSLCTADQRCLQTIYKEVESGNAPSRAMVENYCAIRGRNYLRVLEELASTYANDFVEMAMDI